MHRIDIVVGPEQGYIAFEENRGRAIKRAHSIVRNGYEFTTQGITAIIPPHRILRVDITPVPEGKKNVEKQKHAEAREES